jgi:hypothetical protein
MRRRFGRRAVGHRTRRADLADVAEGLLQLINVNEERRRVHSILDPPRFDLVGLLLSALATRSFTFRSHLRDELEAVHVIATLEVLDALVDRGEQPSPLVGVEVVIDGRPQARPRRPPANP